MVSLHVFRNNSSTSSVCAIDDLLWMFFGKLFDYIECFQLSTITLCVVALLTRAVCMFSLMYPYFDCFYKLIYLVCMFSCYWVYIECFRKLSSITLHVLARKTLLCMFWIKTNTRSKYYCGRTFKVTRSFYTKHVK